MKYSFTIDPNILVNGAGGKAVGMATSIPPHNLVRNRKNIKLLILNNKDITISQLMKNVPGPDFPTGDKIGKDIIKQGYNKKRIV